MQEAAVSSLAAWESFCTIIGSAAAALTGLMFVVITLIAGEQERRRSGDGIAAFGTPTVVHFCTVLLVAATLSAPWQTLWHAGVLLGLAGLGGVMYIGVTLRRTLRQTDYEPVLEDWLWHILFPLVSYTALVVAAFLLPVHPELALFIVAAGAVLFLFVGIHNAWDAVTYFIIRRSQSGNTRQKQ
jgi:hypothetical protein